MFDNLSDQSGPGWTLHHAECVERMRAMSPDTVDAILTDPPYHLTSIKTRDGTNETRARNRSDGLARLAGGFMGKTWDGGDVAFRVETWQAAWRVLKPGGYIMAFASSRGYHRMAVAIEDAGFITHPMIGWVFGSGFPKATDASKMIDQVLGFEREITRDARIIDDSRPDHIDMDPRNSKDRERRDKPATHQAAAWQGWYYGGQVRKPALEPICVAQKPFSERNGALNILRWGVGAVNIDGCRIIRADDDVSGWSISGSKESENVAMSGKNYTRDPKPDNELGRWPANLIHDGSPEVLALFPAAPGQIARAKTDGKKTVNVYGDMSHVEHEPRNDTGSAARFFECYPPVITYCPKANARDRLGSRHPTVKPMALMRSFVRHVCPPGGTVLDPFAGTGTTLRAAVLEDRRAIGIEADAASVVDTVWRMRHAQSK